MDHESHGDSLPEKYGQETPPTYSQPHAIHGNAKGGISEGAELYGDLATAESYGYVARGLKSRHIQFIALGGTIGTGLFLGIGRAFTQAGPLSLLMGYTFTGVAIFAMVRGSTGRGGRA
jgi:amino acid transporter